MDEKNKSGEQKQQVNIILDTVPVLYTDQILNITNRFGIVVNFCQQTGPAQYRAVARIGMSREHAKEWYQELGRLLAMTEGKGGTGKKGGN